jgi:hypothetical protein
MIFRNIEKAEDGSFLFDVEANKDEVAFLVDYAVSVLLSKSVIQIDEEQMNKDQEVRLGSADHTVN